MGNPYDLSSGGGLRALALLDRAHNKRSIARQLRATASMYSDEQEWVRNSRTAANRLEKEAEHLEYSAREK